MNIVKLTNTLGVSAQIRPEDIAEIAAAGYQVVINNRPDGEESTQPSSAEIAAAASAAGLEYHHLPVNATNFPDMDFNAMNDLLNDPARQVLAFCRSGTRCANLWVAGSDDAQREPAMQVARERGFDLGLATNYLTRLS